MEITNILDRGGLGFSVSYERKEIDRLENENSILMLRQIHDIARHHRLLRIICILEHLSVYTYIYIYMCIADCLVALFLIENNTIRYVDAIISCRLPTHQNSIDFV